MEPTSQSVHSAHLSEANTTPHSVSDVYSEVVHWKKRFFKLPTDSAGKRFVTLMCEQIQDFVQSAGTHRTALYNLAVLPALLLQQTYRRSSWAKPKNNTSHLQRRMALWADDNITALVEEGRCLQQHCEPHRGARRRGEQDKARHFGSLMAEGRVHDALHSLSEADSESTQSSGVLGIDDSITINDSTTTVRAALESKHPCGTPASEHILTAGAAPQCHPIRFDSLTADLVKPWPCRRKARQVLLVSTRQHGDVCARRTKGTPTTFARRWRPSAAC